MKEVKDMNLAELADLNPFYLSEKDWRNTQSRLRELHELTRWIPVSERMPTEADGDENGEVLVSETENESPHRKYTYMKRWNKLNDPDYFHTITHWKRITPPEDKP
jgi:hypothetical protein